MALFDKLKETANTVKGKATDFAEEKKLGEKLTGIKDSVKQSIDQNTEAFKQANAENKELKQALEGAIIRYEVIYIGGLPEYPKAKHGNAIGLNVMPDRFAFTKTGTSKEWFNDFDIKYEDITDLTIEKRNISNTEMLLGGGNDPNQQQENNICISFNKEDGSELMLRVEMLTGFSIYGQATKCREFMDILRQNNILKTIKANSQPVSAPAAPQVDVLDQLEKLAKLKDAGILTEDEFNQKKAALLEKI